MPAFGVQTYVKSVKGAGPDKSVVTQRLLVALRLGLKDRSRTLEVPLTDAKHHRKPTSDANVGSRSCSTTLRRWQGSKSSLWLLGRRFGEGAKQASGPLIWRPSRGSCSSTVFGVLRRTHQLLKPIMMYPGLTISMWLRSNQAQLRYQ